jgi:D-3-phosphoglycerate dehydrogenase
MKRRVLITCPQMQRTIDSYRDMFAGHGIEIVLPEVVQQLSENELVQIIEGFDGVIAGDDQFTAPVLTKGKSLKVIVKWGIGVDGIDLEAAKELGIRVRNTPDMFADEVADVVLSYIIMLARKLHRLDASVRNGGWEKIQGISLRNKVLGVIGLGSIGRAVVRRALAAGMVVTGNDVKPVPDAFIEETGIFVVALDELLRTSDFITLNCNLTKSNYHLLGSDEFAIMRHGVYIINTARGALIDEDALVDALKKGSVAGAALDVFEREPLPLNSPLRQFDNLILGTHNSSNTIEAVKRVNEIAVRTLLDELEDD